MLLSFVTRQAAHNRDSLSFFPIVRLRRSWISSLGEVRAANELFNMFRFIYKHLEIRYRGLMLTVTNIAAQATQFCLLLSFSVTEVMIEYKYNNGSNT